MLGIVSGDLVAGERLPSTTELARRFRLHANTVRLAYRELADLGWIEWRRGSGFYVPAANDSELGSTLGLNHLISRFLKAARADGHTLAEIQSAFTRWILVQAPDHVLVVEPDAELREILVAEIAKEVAIRVDGIGMEACTPGRCVGAIVAAFSHRAAQVRAVLPPEKELVFLRSSSIPKALSGERKPTDAEVITIVSRWPTFLQRARAMLAAVGVDPRALDLRDGRAKHWNRGLGANSFIITDSLLASRLPKKCRARTFPIIAGESIAELRNAISSEPLQVFNPLTPER
jgi:GntR family transcriptional regulator